MLASCKTVGPEYKRPEEVKTDEPVWEDASQLQLEPGEVVRFDWWTEFGDQKLNELIKTAVDESYDLKILQSRIKAGNAIVGASKANLAPQVNFDGSAAYQNTAGMGSSTNYDAAVNVSWELDLWGKGKKSVKASKAEVKALEAEYRGGYLKLVSDVASSYFAILQFDRQLAVNEEFVRNSKTILSIYKAQYKAGIVGYDKVLREEATIAEIERDGLEIQRFRKLHEHRIATLLGKPTGTLRLEDRRDILLSSLPEVPVGLPSDLLQRRPDLVAAEYRLIKATQEIGVAEAGKYPSIGLSMKGGFASAALGSLLGGGVFSFMPRISLPMFDGGRTEAQIKKQKALAEAAKYEFAKAVHKAYQEVSDSLTNIANRKKQMLLVEERVESLTTIQKQLNKKLELGLISQLEIRDIEQSLYEARKAVDTLRNNLINDTITLYKALGGGWPKEVISEDIKK